jgi:hypothetical protein
VKADEYCELLRDALVGNTAVRELKLANCDIKCRGAAALGQLLAANHTLEARPTAIKKLRIVMFGFGTS